MSYLLGLLGLAGYTAVVAVVCWHIAAPPWAGFIWKALGVKWLYNNTGLGGVESRARMGTRPPPRPGSSVGPGPGPAAESRPARRQRFQAGGPPRPRRNRWGHRANDDAGIINTVWIAPSHLTQSAGR